MTGDHILVLGDLCWDLNVYDIDQSAFRRQVQQFDSTNISCESRLEVGGSAWLFAKEVIDAGREIPLVMSSVGDDPIGDQLVRQLGELGLSTDLIHRSRRAGTDLICVVRFGTSGRLMLVPHSPVSDDLPPDHVSSLLDAVDPERVRWAWISGYSLARPGSLRSNAATVIADWCHGHDIPVALDLVPHEFRARVGSLDDVVAQLGGVSLLVGALPTFEDFGYGRHPDTNGDVLARMRAVAGSAAKQWGTVLVQTHTSEQTFGQVMYGQDGLEMLNSSVSVVDGVRGVGDRLAVGALQWLSERSGG